MIPTFGFTIFLFAFAFLTTKSNAAPTGRMSAMTTEQLVAHLSPRFYPEANKAALSLFPANVTSWQTPQQVHYVFAISLAGREVYAACDSKALSFFGVRDPIAPRLCTQPNRAKTLSLLFYYTILFYFPNQITLMRNHVLEVGLNPDVNMDDITTPQGWASRVARRLITQYFMKDGWNGGGALDSDGSIYFGPYPRRYADITGYQPQNNADMRPGNLKFPLRWQPLTVNTDGFGDYMSQVHVAPHIGHTVKPVSMDLETWTNSEDLIARPLYKVPNMYRNISDDDLYKLKYELVPDMLRDMRRFYTTPEVDRRAIMFRTYWWDSKIFSLGSLGVYYEYVNGVDPEHAYKSGMGETMALHEATLLAWREKVRHDYARPGTIIREIFRGEKIQDPRTGKMIPAEQWEPLVQTMPHSEYPSGSAVLCTAFTQYVKYQVPYTLARTGKNFTDPGVKIDYPVGAFPMPISGGEPIRIGSLEEAGRDCGNSRLWAGLHFYPAVEEGNRIGKLVGKKVFETWRNLEEGTVPGHCHWCLSESETIG